MGKTWKAWQIAVLLGVLLGAAGTTYGAYSLATGSREPKLGADQQLIPVQYGDVVNQVSTSGSLVFANQEALSFGTQGTVSEVAVAAGQTVKAGQVLAALDAATVTSLEKSVAQARVNLKSSEDALARARQPHTSQDVAQAEATVANARLSLLNAQEARDRLLNPTSEDLLKAEAAVASARLSLRKAQDDLDSLRNGPTEEDLAIVQGDLSLAEKDWDKKLKSARDAFDTASAGYEDVFFKFLGVTPLDSELDQGPATLLASWGASLEVLFDPGQQRQDIGPGMQSAGPPDDDLATRWSEPLVYAWTQLYPGVLVPTCDGETLPRQTICIQKDLDSAWDAYRIAGDSLETVETQAAKALYNAQQALAKLQAEPDPVELASKEGQVALAQASLETAETDMARIKATRQVAEARATLSRASGDQLTAAQANLARAEADVNELQSAAYWLEVVAKEKQAALAQANLEKVGDDLSTVIAGADPLDVAIKEADVASARAALDTAIQRLEAATLKAPFDGLVTQVNVEAGQTISGSAVVVEVADPTLVEVAGTVNEIDVLFVQEGAQAVVTMDALPGQSLNGVVSSVSSAAQTQQGVVSYPVRIRVEVPAGLQLRAGLTASTTIVLREERNVLRVPIQSLYGTFAQPVVKVMNNGRLEDRAVTLGNSDDYWVAVRSGLSEGDRVIMEAAQATTSQMGGAAFRQMQGGMLGGTGSFQITGPGAGGQPRNQQGR